jgi:membrane protease YdiL (CAAX protease family)
MMPPETARYLDLALQGRNAFWRYALGAFTIAFFWLVLGYVPYLLLVSAGLSDQLLEYLAVNFSIFMMLMGLVLTVKLIHHRPLLSLVTPEARLDWRRIGRGALVWAVIAALVMVIESLLYPGRYYVSFDPGRFFVFLAVVLLLTPIQAAAEELVFRGYAMQGLARLTRRPALIAVASSFIFTAPHLLNPEVYEHGAIIMAAN